MGTCIGCGFKKRGEQALLALAEPAMHLHIAQWASLAKWHRRSKTASTINAASTEIHRAANLSSPAVDADGLDGAGGPLAGLQQVEGARQRGQQLLQGAHTAGWARVNASAQRKQLP